LADRAAPREDPAGGLMLLGLRPGEQVRWRSQSGGRWRTGTVTRRERDGSIAVTDRRGAARSMPVDRLEVACSGPRGAAAWEPLAERALRNEQLRLL
jgi:hypothetical protein